MTATAEAGRRGARGWWRRNAAALIALAVLVPATFGVIVLNEASTNATRAHVVPIEVPAGRPFAHEGTQWGPVSGREITPDDDMDVPPGARLYEVTVPVVPGDEEPGCFPPTLVEARGAHRQWDRASTVLGWNTTSCALMGTEPFDVVVPFVLPADAEGPFVVDLEVVSDPPSTLRLPVDG